MHGLKKISTFAYVLYVFGLLAAIGPAAVLCAADIRIGQRDDNKRLWGSRDRHRPFPFRKLLLFIFSVTMIIAGLYFAVGELLWAPHLYSKVMLAGVFPAFLGGYLLWVDFIAPVLGIKTGEE
jgi:hypothetical protein